MTSPLSKYQVGQRVVVIQQMPRQQHPMASEVTGTIVRFGQSKTGSWYAHSKDDKFWLDRLELRKDDGELVVLNLDQYSRIEPAPQASATRQQTV